MTDCTWHSGDYLFLGALPFYWPYISVGQVKWAICLGRVCLCFLSYSYIGIICWCLLSTLYGVELDHGHMFQLDFFGVTCRVCRVHQSLVYVLHPCGGFHTLCYSLFVSCNKVW